MRTLRIILETLFWMVAAFVLFGCAMIVMGYLTAPAIGYGAGLAVIVLLPLVVQVVKQIRRRRAAAIVAYLEQAVRLNLPLSRMLHAAQRGEDGRTAVRLVALRQQLEEGYSLGTALQLSVPEADARAVSILDAAERLGRLRHALHALMRERPAARLGTEPNLSGFFRAYPFMMVLVITTCLSIMTVFVMPKYQVIFKDFGLKMPPLTSGVFDVMSEVGAVVLVVAFASMLWWAGSLLWEIFHDDRTSASGVSTLQTVRDHILWRLPIAHGMARDRGLADAFTLIADALRAGLPADRAISEAATLRMNAVLRARLTRWAERAGQGDTLADAARAASLPNLTVQMLAAARGADQAADVLDFLARYHAARFSRARLLLQNAGVPLMTLFFAVIVAYLTTAFFAPLITLIDSLSSHAGKWRL